MSTAARKPGLTPTGRSPVDVKPPLGLIVLSGEYLRVHVALMTAAAAASIDRKVVFFVTMDAVPLLLHSEGWRQLDGASRDDDMKARGVADIETLLEACRALDVSFIVCESGLRATGWDAEALRDDTEIEVAGLVTLIHAIDHGEMVSF